MKQGYYRDIAANTVYSSPQSSENLLKSEQK